MSFNRIFGFMLCMYTDHTLPSDSIMTVDACDRRLVTYFARESLADLKYKEKEQRGRFAEINEKILREEYTLDWSQSKVFLVERYVRTLTYSILVYSILEPCCPQTSKQGLQVP